MKRPSEAISETTDELRAGDVLLLPVALAAFWTLAYQLVLVARWPAWMIICFFFAISALGFFFLSRLWAKTHANPFRGYRFHRSHLLLFVLAIACAVAVLFIRRANQDDVVYFHRVLTQLSALDQPIITRQTSVDMDAAAFSPVHLATSHEMLMGLVGHYLGIDPLYCYQVVGHVFTAFLIPFVLYWCVRRFGLDRWPAAIGALFGVAFLLVDNSPVNAGFGNMAFGLMWQGKVIVYILFLPVALSLSYRFLRQGNHSDLVWLVLLAIAGVGLSNVALYLIPAAIGCSCLSFLGVELVEHTRREDLWREFRRCCLMAIPLAYPVAILALLKLNVIPRPIDIRFLGPQYIPWRRGLDTVVGTPAEYVRDVVLMVAAPLIIVRGKHGLFLFFYICAVWLLCLNPLLAHWWMKNIFATDYYRLVYLLPLPLLCAMLPAAGRSWTEMGSGGARHRMLTGLALLGIIVSFIHSYRAMSIMPRNAQVAWKSPREYQLLKANTDFAEAAGKYIDHSKLLAPGWTASCELPLLFPQMKVVAPRLVLHYFANAGNLREGALRQMAQEFVEGKSAYYGGGKTVSPQRAAEVTAAFRTTIKSGRADAVASPEAESARVLAALQAIDPRWHRVLEAGGLVLMLPTAQESEDLH